MAGAAASPADEMLLPPPMNATNPHNDPDDSADIAAATIDTDKLSYEIFSILESKFLFGYDDHQLWLPPLPSPAPHPPPPSDPSSLIKTQRGKVCILSLDGGGGGGMRGILPGKALSFLQQSLRSKSGDPTASISDYFDLVAGTGVGGLFAAMLFSTRDGHRPVFDADDTWRFLVSNGKRLFRKQGSASSPPSFFSCVFNGGSGGGGATESMERAIKETFGKCLTLRNTVKPLLIPCYDMLTSAPLVFSRADALESESFDFRLWEVCRATWAEPGRFEPVEMRSVDGKTACVGVDGGLAMSNPSAAAITHVLHNKQEFPFVRGVEDVMVLSVGCGSGVGSGCGGVADSGSGSGSAEYQRIRKWGTREWARPIARIASDAAADLVDHAVAMSFGQCRSSNYIRIQANGSSLGQCGADADCDPSTGNVKMLLGAAEEMLKQKNVESVMFGGKRIGEQTNMEKLDWFAGELVLEHQRRGCRIAPTVAFKQPAPMASGNS